jgi:hypothetical protein
MPEKELSRKVVHVCTPFTAQGSRLFFQNELLPGEILATSKTFFSLEIILLAFRKESLVVVFHQQMKLILLMQFYILNFILKKDHKVVYDMHDMSELHSLLSLRGRIFVSIQMLIERLIAKLPINIITVSNGLASEFYTRNNKMPSIVYNMAAKNSLIGGFGSRKVTNRMIYFGQITPDRLDLKIVRELVSSGFVLDIYGVATEKNRPFLKKLNSIIVQNGGEIKGKYIPGEMHFLENYSYSFVVFQSARKNIKYCMPNKLYQSLSAGLICIVADDSIEMTRCFETTGYVVRLSELKGIPATFSNFAILKKLLEEHLQLSTKNFIDACVAG